MENQFSIKDIEQLTGIKAHTIRIWEQRYSIPKPKRTATNFRYYNDDDLKLLLNIAMLNKQGHRISEITKLNEKQMADLITEHAAKNGESDLNIHALIIAMMKLDEVAFEKILLSNILKGSLEQTMLDVFFPFLKTVGNLWQTGNINPAYEHFITNLIRQKIIIATDGLAKNYTGQSKRFILFLPQGETHEIGLLFAQYMIRKRGHHVLYLGQNLPLKDLDEVYEKYHPDYLLTALTLSASLFSAEKFIRETCDRFPQTQFLISGYYAQHHAERLPSAVKVLHNFEMLNDIL